MISLTGTKTAIAPNNTASFLGSGGTAPYTYSVLPNGAGGTINASSGIYTSPARAPYNTDQLYDTIQVTDSLSATATAQILVGTPWMLIVEILQRLLGLPQDHCYLWDQKIFETDDNRMFLITEITRFKSYASGINPAGSNTQNGPGWDRVQKWTNVGASLDIHIKSRSLEALNRKEEVLMALVAPYCESQQEANSFYIARLPLNAVDVSGIDGADIPYHFVISVNIMYAMSQIQGTDYYDSFPVPAVYLNP